MVYIVETGTRDVRTQDGTVNSVTYLADIVERTAPLVAHTRFREEAVRLSKEEAEAQALVVKGKAVRYAPDTRGRGDKKMKPHKKPRVKNNFWGSI